MKRRVLFALILLLNVLTIHAQRIDYENTSKYFWGANIGHAWHSTDVQNVKGKFPLGASLIAGRSFNQDYGKLISFDLRARLLYGRWFGQDRDTTSFLQNSFPYNALHDSLTGYGVQNFRASQLSLDIELSLHFNRLRETHGIDPYIFAGIGVVGTNSKGAITTGVNENGDKIDIKNYDFSTPLVKNEEGDTYSKFGFEGNILPSLGVGIGYYFNSRFSLGIEHRTTFFKGDYLDGTTVNYLGNESKFKNDVYHYTSIYFKWYFKVKEKKERIPPVKPEVEGPTYTDNQPVRKTPPVVNFTNPRSPGITVNNPNYKLIASIQHVESANNVTFNHNGVSISNFYFNPNNNTFESQVVLQEGKNTFVLSGRNKDGTDLDQTVIIYQEEKRYPPIVNIVDPSTSPHTVSQLNYIVKASIQHIDSKNQLQVSFNDKPLTAYSFSPNGSVNFTANLSLSAGVNTLRIKGVNAVGTDQDETVLIYKRQPVENAYPPTVNIYIPSVSPYSSNKDVKVVAASVTNVTSKSQVSVKVNGVNTTNFTYSNGDVRLNAALINGSNHIEIKATNPYGSASDAVQIVSRKPVENYPPTVGFVTPANSPYTTSSASTAIVAMTQNISSKSQVSVKVNGSNVGSFTFNTASKLVNFTANLIPGNNIVVVEVQNEYGQDKAETFINYNAPVKNPPSVAIKTPNKNPYSTSNVVELIKATTTNISSKSQVEVQVNGSSVSNFTFNVLTKEVQFNASLMNGNNTVKITVSNNDGTASDALNILLRKPTVLPPTVKITSPSSSPYNTTSSTEVVKASTVNVSTKSQVEVRVNGATTNNFTFNTATKVVQLTAGLVSGSNIVRITATNDGGSAYDEATIIYRQPVKNPPTVVITKPVSTPVTTMLSTQEVVAKVTHINAKSQVAVKVNNVSTNNFTFNSANQTVSLNVPLVEGANNVLISVQNQDGMASAETVVNFKPLIAKRPPVVTITKPAKPGTVVANEGFGFEATVLYVNSKADITVKLNGKTVNSNAFTYNASNNKLVYSAKLSKGKNTLEVIGKNKDGVHSASTDVTYTAINIKDPIVICLEKDYPKANFLYPTTVTSNVEYPEFKVIANLVNIDKANQIAVYFNGTKKSNFVFNAQTKSLNDAMTLKPGLNTYKLVLANDCKTIEQEIVVNYNPVLCGVEFEVIKGAEFCLNIGGQTINADYLLNNPNFTYKGETNQLYFKAINNGTATVANQDMPMVKNNFYSFAGIFNVDVKKENGKWIVCVEAARSPLFGKGKTKPTNPCLNINLKPQDTKVIDKKNPKELPTPQQPTTPNQQEKKPIRNPGRR